MKTLSNGITLFESTSFSEVSRTCFYVGLKALTCVFAFMFSYLSEPATVCLGEIVSSVFQKIKISDI